MSGTHRPRALEVLRNERMFALHTHTATSSCLPATTPRAVQLADEVGVDVAYHTAATMKAALGERMAGGASEAWVKSMVDKKLLGRKTGGGFYLYPVEPKGGKKKGGKSERALNPAMQAELAPYLTAAAKELPLEAAVERMVLRFVKECMHSLEDGVISSPGGSRQRRKVPQRVRGMGFTRCQRRTPTRSQATATSARSLVWASRLS